MIQRPYWLMLLAGMYLLHLSCASGVAADVPSDAASAIKLFDGKSLKGWTTLSGEPVPKQWRAEDGVLHLVSKGGGHIVTEQEYGDFILDFEWKIAPGGNSGLKYRVGQFGKKVLGCEFQLLDDAGHSNGKNPLTQAGALYGLYAPSKDRVLKPVGEFNQAKVSLRGPVIQHWLNGVMIVEADTSSEDWRNRIANSKFNDAVGFAQQPTGRIMLQDHGSEVWFRNIVLQPIPTESTDR